MIVSLLSPGERVKSFVMKTPWNTTKRLSESLQEDSWSHWCGNIFHVCFCINTLLQQPSDADPWRLGLAQTLCWGCCCRTAQLICCLLWNPSLLLLHGLPASNTAMQWWICFHGNFADSQQFTWILLVLWVLWMISIYTPLSSYNLHS